MTNELGRKIVLIASRSIAVDKLERISGRGTLGARALDTSNVSRRSDFVRGHFGSFIGGDDGVGVATFDVCFRIENAFLTGSKADVAAIEGATVAFGSERMHTLEIFLFDTAAVFMAHRTCEGGAANTSADSRTLIANNFESMWETNIGGKCKARIRVWSDNECSIKMCRKARYFPVWCARGMCRSRCIV